MSNHVWRKAILPGRDMDSGRAFGDLQEAGRGPDKRVVYGAYGGGIGAAPPDTGTASIPRHPFALNAAPMSPPWYLRAISNTLVSPRPAFCKYPNPLPELVLRPGRMASRQTVFGVSPPFKPYGP